MSNPNMNPNVNNNGPTRDLRPQDVANSLFTSALRQHKGNERDAALQTIMFLTEALVAAIHAASGDNLVVRSGLLKQAAATITGVGSTMAALGVSLSRYAERRVFDHTGLEGRYDFTLQWSEDVSIFTALQE